jgi:hypothetical protein
MDQQYYKEKDGETSKDEREIANRTNQKLEKMKSCRIQTEKKLKKEGE